MEILPALSVVIMLLRKCSHIHRLSVTGILGANRIIRVVVKQREFLMHVIRYSSAVWLIMIHSSSLRVLYSMVCSYSRPEVSIHIFIDL